MFEPDIEAESEEIVDILKKVADTVSIKTKACLSSIYNTSPMWAAQY